ncbi:hypothetical protein RhiirB3_456077 [Rhizophagus irregularis]|nr:hypothetical protein RhiirB3_456077 [Rhizophagus irregularis]
MDQIRDKIWIKSGVKYRKIWDEIWINPFSPQINLGFDLGDRSDIYLASDLHMYLYQKEDRSMASQVGLNYQALGG